MALPTPRELKIPPLCLLGTVHVTVVRIRECCLISVPVVLVFVDVVSQHCEDRAVITFDLAVRLWVIRGDKDVPDSEKRADSLE